jgi:outer membrane protein assembly factor BamA
MAAPLLTAAALAATLTWGQTPVKRVDIVAPAGVGSAELVEAFGVTPGSPLSRDAIRAGVQTLLATGKVEDVVVGVTPEAMAPCSPSRRRWRRASSPCG